MERGFIAHYMMGRVLADCVTRTLSFVDVESTAVSDREVVLREGHTMTLGRDRYHGEAEFHVTKDQVNDWRLTPRLKAAGAWELPSSMTSR
jgi:hypothetical protein